MSEDEPVNTAGTGIPGEMDFSRLDDAALFGKRAEMRAELERLPQASSDRAALAVLYDLSTREVNDRARRAWARAGKAGQ